MESCTDEMLRRQYEILDTYDFIPYLELYDDIDDLMYNFEYECEIDALPPEFQNCVFNFISREEFVDYLRERYPNYHFDEIIRWNIRPAFDLE